MRHLKGHILLAFCAMFAGICAAQQASSVAAATTVSVPNLIRYSAALKDARGAALPTATTGVTFAIYNQQDGGAPPGWRRKTWPAMPAATTACC